MQEDHVTMGWSAARKLRTEGDGLAAVLAIEVVTAARALRDVQTHRSIANPNSGFRAQLRRWETALQRARAARGLPPLRRAAASAVTSRTTVCSEVVHVAMSVSSAPR
jgi:histidine ammonia-lyase